MGVWDVHEFIHGAPFFGLQWSHEQVTLTWSDPWAELITHRTEVLAS
jgi:hypothetical protein